MNSYNWINYIKLALKNYRTDGFMLSDFLTYFSLIHFMAVLQKKLRLILS